MFSGGSYVAADFDQLCARMRSRLYPETMVVLTLYWLKTVWNKGYKREDWNALDRLLQQQLGGETDPHRRQALENLQLWIHDKDIRAAHDISPTTRESPRQQLNGDSLLGYIVRLANEWVPVEVSRLLVEEPEDGIPAATVGRAFERLLLREGVTKENLEALLEPGLMSPRFMYPLDYEILGDVALYLLGRTSAPVRPVLPAALLFILPGARLSADYATAVQCAQLADSGETEELNVPIARAQALEALAGAAARITSRVVTMDGRWWQAGNLTSTAEQNMIVYRPAGRVRIDYSSEHARIRVLWPEARYRWTGDTNFDTVMHVFGREWRLGRWEQDAEHTWVDLVFTRWLRACEMGFEPAPRRSQPASVDLAWAALEESLAVCLSEKRPDAIEKLRREEMIPLARSIVALMEAAGDVRNAAAVEARLQSVGYFDSALRVS